MNNVNLKKLILPNLPYLLFVYLFDKAAQAVRFAPGADLSGKLLYIGDGFTAAFHSLAPSFHGTDILIGIAGAVLIRLIVYTKGKNAKKYRWNTVLPVVVHNLKCRENFMDTGGYAHE